MELLQLRYFFESANLESFAKTAEKYMVPASSVSASVKRLEAELGCRLFDRTSNRIVLNENGKRMMNSLKVIFDELDRMSGGLTDQADDTRETRILVKALRTIVTDLVIRYKAEHLNTKFRLISEFNEMNGENYDIIIDTESDSYIGYERFELYRQRIWIYAAEDSPLCGHRLTLKQLADQPFAAMSQYGNQYKILMRACQREGFKPNIVAQINDTGCFLKFIESGVAIGAGGELSIQIKNNLRVEPLNVTDFKEYQTVCVYYRKEAAYGNVKRFIEFLRARGGMLRG